MKIIVLGSNGQLGRCLQDEYLLYPELDIIFLAKKNLDITSKKKLKEILIKNMPDIVINCAAYTAVDNAENEKNLAYDINHNAVKSLASLCKEFNVILYHISTDYVFDGMAKSPYYPHEPKKPISTYGRSKLKGEESIIASGCKYIILRTSWVFSEYSNNFFTTMLSLGAKKKELSIVSDQVGCPTYAKDLARAILESSYKVSKKGFKSDVYHFCGREDCSWFEFALLIFKKASENNFPVPQNLIKIHTKNYITLAPRPLYSVLNCSKFTKTFDISQPLLNDGLTEAFLSINTGKF